MHLERNPTKCVCLCERVRVILISHIQSWILGHVRVLQLDEEQRLSDYTCKFNLFS